MTPAIVAVPRSKEGLTGWQQIAAGRRYLQDKAPYLTSAIMMLAPVEAPGLGTVGVTDTMILLVDLEYIVTRSVPGVAADLAHEISHVLRDTAGRGKRLGACTDELHKLSNIASDIAINPDIEAMGLPILTGPSPGVQAKNFDLPDGLMDEEYYWGLIKKKEENAENGEKLDGSPLGDGVNEVGDQPGCGKGRCGSGGGHAMPNEPSQDDPAGRGPGQANNGNGGYPGRTPAEIDRARRHTAEAIAKAAAQGRGNIPGGWQRWAEGELEPAKVSWQSKLARTARAAVRYRSGSVDTTYSRPARRQAAMGFGMGHPIMPRFRAPVTEILMGLDSSGSMGDTDFMAAGSEVVGILKTTGCDLWFTSMDTEVYGLSKVKSWTEAAGKVHGGGGTDFHAFFDMIEEKRTKELKNVKVVLVFTDGYCGVPDAQPEGISVIWVLTRPGAQVPCDWGDVINLFD